MFDLGLTPMHYSCLFNMFIPLSSFFMWEPLGQWLMRFSMHRITYMRGMGIISLGSLSLVSFHFFHTITLVYVMSCVLRPPRGHDFTHCVWQLTHGWYLRLVGYYCLEHDGWGVDVMDYTRAYPSYQWWIFKGDVIYTRAYPAHRWQFLIGMTSCTEA